jgi:uncharacterized protein (DUF3084 family)
MRNLAHQILEDRQVVYGVLKAAALLVIVAWIISGLTGIDKAAAFTICFAMYLASALLTTYRAQHIAKQLDFIELEAQLADSQAEYQRMGEEAQHAVETLRDSLAESQKVVAEQAEKLAEIEEKHGELRSRHQAVSTDRQSLESRKKSLESQNSQLQEQVQRQQERIKTLEAAFELSEKKVEGFKHRMERAQALEKEVEELKGRNRRLSAKIARAARTEQESKSSGKS